MANPTRVLRVLLLGALLVHGGCGDSEPGPQHPTHTAKKKHKKHADSDVVVSDDSDSGDSDDDAPKKVHHKVAQTDDDDAPKKKVAKKDDDDDAPKKKDHKKAADDDDDAPKKKVHKLTDDDDDAPKKKIAKKDDDDDAPKKKEHKLTDDDDDAPKKKIAKKDDDDAPKKKDHKKVADDDDDAPKKKVAKKDDDPPKKEHKLADDDDDAPKRKLAKKDDDDTPKKKLAKQDDDDAPKKPGADTAKKAHHGFTDIDAPPDKPDHADDDDAPKKADDTAAKPAATHPKVAKRKKSTRRKKAAAHTPAKTGTTDTTDSGAGEIEMDEDPLASGTETTADASDDENDAAVAAPMPAPAEPVVSSLAINDRALLTRPSALEVHGGLRTAVLTLPGVMAGTSTSSTSEGLALGASYGIGAKAEVGADYVLSLHPGAVKGPLSFHAAYLAFARGKIDVAVAGALAVDFQDTTDPTSGMTTSKAAFGLELGGWVRYRATPKVSLFTGLPALPSSAASLSKLSFALPPLPYQLAIGLGGGGTIALDLPAGIGFQATPTIYAFAMTDLAHLKISNTANAFLFADFIPITVGGFYAMKQLDLGATLADDLKQGAGYLNFELIARYAL